MSRCTDVKRVMEIFTKRFNKQVNMKEILQWDYGVWILKIERRIVRAIYSVEHMESKNGTMELGY